MDTVHGVLKLDTVISQLAKDQRVCALNGGNSFSPRSGGGKCEAEVLTGGFRVSALSLAC